MPFQECATRDEFKNCSERTKMQVWTNGVILAERLFLGLTFAFPVQSYLTSCPIGRATDIHSVDWSAYRSEVIKL